MYRQALHTPSSRVKLLVAIFIVTLAENQLGQQGLVLRTAIIGSSLGLAGLISVPRNCWLTFALGILAIRVVALFAAGMAPTLALLLAVGVTVQIALASLFLRWRLKDGLDLTRAGQLLDLALAGLIVAPAMGLMVDVLFRRISLAQAANPRTLWQYFSTHDGIITLADWVMPHVLGMVVVVPLALAAITRGIRHPLEWLSRERGALYALLLLAHLLVFSQANAQMLMLVPPALALIAIRLGIRETLLAMLLSMGIASVATANGLGAVAAIYADPPHQISFLRHFYIFAFLCFMPVAATLERNRRLELSLARNTRFTDQILRGMQEVVFRTDMQGRWSFLNPAWLDLTGYSVAESIGTAMRALVSAEGHAEFDEALALLMADDAPEAKLSLDMRRRDGTLRECEVTLRPLRHADGHIAGLGGILRDITEARRHLRALESSERRFRDLCDTAPVGILRTDLAGQITYVNATCELTDLARCDRLLGRALGDWLLGTEGFAPAALARQLGVPAARIEREAEIRDNAGERRWLTVVVTSDFDAAGQQQGYVAAFADITSRKQAELALAEKSAELTTMAENISDVIFRITFDGLCLYATPSVLDLTGLPAERLVGTRTIDRVHPEDRPRMGQALARMARGEVDFVSISYRARADGSRSGYLWHEAHCRLVRDGQGQPAEVIASVRDIDERKRLELELIEARARAEAAATAKSTFLANISHEIRTPMNGVIGLTDLLLERELDATTRQYVQLIADSGATMMHLLNGVLDLAKLEADRLVLADEVIDIRELLAGALALMTAPARAKALETRLDIAADLPPLMRGDRLRLRQVLANLLGNAVKFTDAGHVALCARTQGAELVICVADTGMGIAPEAQAAVFEEFVQATAGRPGGTGLGLPISRRLIEAMGGTLTMASAPGEGTAMTIRLPARFMEDRRAAAPAPARPATPVAEAGAQLHILVAEDNRTNQIIASGMLKRLGHRHAIAGNGAEAVARVAEARAAGDPYDLVLMDMLMPEMDGLEATRALRAQGFGAAELPIIAVTANAFAEDVARCLEAGMQAHLAKPLQLAPLGEALELAARVRATGDGSLWALPREQDRRQTGPALTATDALATDGAPPA